MNLGIAALITVMAAFIVMYLREMRSDGAKPLRLAGPAAIWLAIILGGYGLATLLGAQ